MLHQKVVQQKVLLKQAKKAGAPIKNGLDMLIFQGLESLQIWTEGSFDSQDIFPELQKFLITMINERGV